MTTSWAVTSGGVGQRRFARGSLLREAALRLRFSTYLSILALGPLIVAFWALAAYAGRSEGEQADADLNAFVRAGVAELEGALDDADAEARDVAASTRVQRALARRDVDVLARLASANDNTRFFAGPLVAGHVERPSLDQAVNVVVDGKSVGRVVVAVPLNERLLARVRRQARLPAGDLLVAAVGERVVAGPAGINGTVTLEPGRPGDVRLGRTTYRALAAPLPGGDAGTELVAARPKATIEAAAAGERARIALAALAMVGAVALVAYAFAPAVARGRIAVQQRALAARVLSSVGDGVFLVDGKGSITFWNPGAEAITGLARASVLGRRVDEVIRDWKAVAERVHVARRPHEPGDRARAETVPAEIGDTELWLSLSGVEFADGTVYTFRDVTEERRLEEAKADFVATASHELRTPVASVYGAAMTLRRSDLPLGTGVRDQLLATIAEQSEKLARIVEDMLLTSELSAGTFRLANERFDPLDVGREVVEAARLRLPAGISLDTVARGPLPAVLGDRGKARQVLANLVDNAVKYSPDGGRIEVTMEARDGFLRFAVRDHGLGIPASEQERIFEKFYRLDPNHIRGARGTGLGLYIARDLVRGMNGRIWVASTPGTGSTFTFELPLATTESGQG